MSNCGKVLPKFEEVFLKAEGVMPKAKEVMPKTAPATAKVNPVKDKRQIALPFFSNASPFFEVGYRFLTSSVPHLGHSVAENCDGVAEFEQSDRQNRKSVAQKWKSKRQFRSAFFTCVNISLFFGAYRVLLRAVIGTNTWISVKYVVLRLIQYS